MALFDLFGISSSPDYLSGFMSEEERRRLQERAGQNALLQAGLSMLGQSGYSRTPVSLGQILGAGGQAGLQAYQGTLQQGAQDVVMRQRMEEMKRKQAQDVMQMQAIEKAAQQYPEYADAIRANPELLKDILKSQINVEVDYKDAGDRLVPVNKRTGEQIPNLQPISKANVSDRLTTLIATRDRLAAENPNNPNIKLYQDAINKETQFAPPMQLVTLPQPMEAINPKTGRAELVQFPNRPGMQPQFTGLEKPQEVKNLKPFPVAQASAVSGNASSIAKIDKAIAEVSAAPEDSFGLMNYAGNVVRQRTDPAGNKARSAVSAVGSQKFHDLSGAAVPAAEASRLTPYIPQTTGTKENILQKLQNMKAEYQAVNDQLLATYNEEQGYKPLNVNIAPIKEQPSATPSKTKTAAPKGVPQELWNVMTEEEKKLWR